MLLIFKYLKKLLRSFIVFFVPVIPRLACPPILLEGSGNPEKGTGFSGQVYPPLAAPKATRAGK